MNESPSPPPRQPDIGDHAGMRMLLPVGRSGWAIASGYLGLFALLLVPAPLALITGIIAVVHIRRSEGTDKPRYGMGRAIFGIIMGTICSAILAWALIGMAGS